jgi:hypothetical protein
MSKLIPGGLALLLRSHFPEDTGHCVTTVQLVAPGCEVQTPEGPMKNWTSMALWYITGDVSTEFFSGRIIFGHALARPGSLLPINPEKVEEKETAEVA